MKKQYSILCILFGCAFSYAQNPEIKNDMPVVIPPSPSVSALMKFEETPVSNYTGIPDVSVPLFSTGTHSKDINLNLLLRYHPGSIAVDEKASDVGLGWSLAAGGTISRSVRGLPDEILITATSQSKVRIGMYHSYSASSTPINQYYYFKENIANATQDFYLPNLPTTAYDIGNEFLWTVAYTNRYDTEHDLWQFNFMGYSGRFYIKKNTQNNLLEVTPLDDYRVKIINNYTTVGNNPYVPIGFTVYDEKGYKYIFDAIEQSVNKVASSSVYLTSNIDYQVSETGPVDNFDADKPFNSSFHLSKVFDPNNNLLIDYIFNTNQIIESVSNVSTEYKDFDHCSGCRIIPECGDFPPIRSTTTSTTLVYVKKVQKIDVKNFAEIYFDYVKGREDSNLNLNSEAAYLNAILIQNYNQDFIKKLEFVYDYSIVETTKRMILKTIKEYGANNQFNSYKFSYKKNNSFDLDIGKDFWGYFNLIKPCISNKQDTSPEFCTTDVLEKITYPSGGSAVFHYESNTYSFIGDQEITDFSENPENTIEINMNPPVNPVFYANGSQTIPIATDHTTKVKFNSGVVLNQYQEFNHTSVWLRKWNGSEFENVIPLMCQYNDPECCIEWVLEKDVQYDIKFTNLDINTITFGSVECRYYTKNPNQKRYLLGGGIRIKTIEYFEALVLDDLENIGSLTPSKKKNYRYNFFSIANQSSGSLVYPKPTYTYQDSFGSNTSISGFNSMTCVNPTIIGYTYVGTSSGIKYPAIKTSGSDVGYQEVEVFETGNGKTEYTYTSPINFPEIGMNLEIPPFIPSENIDYKRGNLQKEEVYNFFNNQYNKLSVTNFYYDYVDYREHTGTRFRKPVGQCYTGSLFNSYGEYLSGYSYNCVMCTPHLSFRTNFLCGLPLDISSPKIMPLPIFEAYGWAQLKSKITKNYFYPPTTSVQNFVQTTETYQYNPLNKKISESTVTTSNGNNEKLITKYFYHTGNSTYSQNRISEIEKIETYRDANLLSTSQINYANTFAGNVAYLPQTIATAKAGQPLEDRVRYNLYDEFSNPLELQQENGTKVCYIWGYNKTQPVAKIENIDYSAIPSNLITSIQNASNAPNNEAAVLSALGALRIHNALSNTMITTYTYKPVVGVSTITDPKGDTVTYFYDDFNRLKEVKDKQNNILSANEYHYKLQN